MKELKIEIEKEINLVLDNDNKTTINNDGKFDIKIDGQWITGLSKERFEDLAELIKKTLEYNN